MKRKIVSGSVVVAAVAGAYGLFGVTRTFYPIPMGRMAYGVIHPALHLTSGQEAVDQARRYAGTQWSRKKLVSETFGVVETPQYHGPAWLVVDHDAQVPSTGPNPQTTGLKGGFLTTQTLHVAVILNRSTGRSPYSTRCFSWRFLTVSRFQARRRGVERLRMRKTRRFSRDEYVGLLRTDSLIL